MHLEKNFVHSLLHPSIHPQQYYVFIWCHSSCILPLHTQTTPNIVFSVNYGILCHYGNVSNDTSYDQVYKYYHE